MTFGANVLITFTGFTNIYQVTKTKRNSSVFFVNRCFASSISVMHSIHRGLGILARSSKNTEVYAFMSCYGLSWLIALGEHFFDDISYV